VLTMHIFNARHLARAEVGALGLNRERGARLAYGS
jgi:hypothetical protein